MKTNRICLIIVVLLLLLAILGDLGGITFGGLFTADDYYLPLRDIDVGKARDAIEASLIKSHTEVLSGKHRILLFIHTLALALVLTVFVRTRPVVQPPDR